MLLVLSIVYRRSYRISTYLLTHLYKFLPPIILTCSDSHFKFTGLNVGEFFEDPAVEKLGGKVHLFVSDVPWGVMKGRGDQIKYEDRVAESDIRAPAEGVAMLLATTSKYLY